MEIGALHCRSQAVLDSVENLLVHAVFIFTPKLFFLKAFAVGSVMAALQASFLFLKALSYVLSIVRLGLSSSLRLFFLWFIVSFSPWFISRILLSVVVICCRVPQKSGSFPFDEYFIIIEVMVT